jgi:hypothetical protein
MKTKQIFSITVLVGIAFAGIALAGPTAVPPGNNVGSPIFSSYLSNIDQSKLGSVGTNNVRHALSIGLPSFPTVNPATLYVDGTTVVGSLSATNDPVRIVTNINTDSFQVNDTIIESTGMIDYQTVTDSTVTVNGLATDFSSSYKPLCANGVGKVVICN